MGKRKVAHSVIGGPSEEETRRGQQGLGVDARRGPLGNGEERRGPKQGELQWVPPLERRGNFRLWLFQFRAGADLYLSQEVYPVPEVRRLGYLNALTRAATLGKNEELLIELELLHAEGSECEALLDKVVKIYQPQDALLKQRAGEELLAFKREGRLGESLRKLNTLVLECRKAGYRPESETLCLKYKSLLRKDEVALFEVYFAKDEIAEGESTDQRMRRVLEAYARDREGILKEQEHAGFAGAAIGNRQGSRGGANGRGRGGGKRGRGGRRHGYLGGDSKQQGSGGGDKGCSKCGATNCKALTTGKASDCFYFKLKCRRCHQVGHKASCCPQASDRKPNGQAYAAQEGDDHEDESQGGDNPPGFPPRQPRC